MSEDDANFLGVDSSFFSTIALFKKMLCSLGFLRFSRRKDPWKEWKWKVPLEIWNMPVGRIHGFGVCFFFVWLGCLVVIGSYSPKRKHAYFADKGQRSNAVLLQKTASREWKCGLSHPLPLKAKKPSAYRSTVAGHRTLGPLSVMRRDSIFKLTE